MRDGQQQTPPSSLNGDEIGMEDDDEVYYLDEMEEIELEDLEMLAQQEDEDMEPPVDLSTLVFDKHDGSVFCCDLHPNGLLACTGGEDDKAYVWSVETGQIVMDTKDAHKDSVVFVGFSFDGAYLATADMCGQIRIWKVNTENQPWEMVFEYLAEDLNWGLWHFGARVLMCGSVSGDISVHKIPSGETKVLQGFNSKVECGKLFPDGVRLATGYEDGSVRVWDLKASKVLHTIPASVHEEVRVTAIDTHSDNNLMASISFDGKVVLATSLNGKVVGQVEVGENDLETVAFCRDPQLDYFALGTLNGAVNIWDTARRMVRHNCSKPLDERVSGVTKMFWVKSHLVTGCLDGAVRVYEGRAGTKDLELTGHRSEVLDLCYNAEKDIILTVSDDGTARIFKYDVNKGND